MSPYGARRPNDGGVVIGIWNVADHVAPRSVWSSTGWWGAWASTWRRRSSADTFARVSFFFCWLIFLLSFRDPILGNFLGQLRLYSFPLDAFNNLNHRYNEKQLHEPHTIFGVLVIDNLLKRTKLIRDDVSKIRNKANSACRYTIWREVHM